MLKEKLQKFWGNKNAKTVASNFAWLSVLQIAGYIFPLITMPYLARVIGVDGFGKIAFASAVISWIQTIADWGFNYTATRDIAQNRDNPKIVSKIFSNVLWSRLLLVICSFFVLILLICIVSSFRNNYKIILVTFLMIPGHVLFPDWFFQALEKMKYTTIFNLFIKFLFTLLVFICIDERDDYIYQPLFVSIGYAICGVFSMWLIFGKWGYILLRPQFISIKSTIKNSFDVFINNLMPNLYNSFSVMLLGSCYGASANGIFEGGNKFISIAYQFHNVLSRAFFPYLSRQTDKVNLFAKLNMITGSIIALTLFIMSPLIVNIMLAPEFAESVIVLRIFAVSMFFMLLSNTYGTNYLIIIHEEKKLRNITICCSLIGLLLSYPLVKYYSYIGATLTVFISRMLLGIFIWWCAKHQRSRLEQRK